MFGMSMTEIAIIAVVALLILGPGELPQAARTLGKAWRQMQRAGDDLRDTIHREIMEERPVPKLRPVAESLPAGTPAPETPAPEAANVPPVGSSSPAPAVETPTDQPTEARAS